jgi:hypothetical protein
MREKSGKLRVIPWVPALLGVVALIGFAGITIFRLTPGHSTLRTLPPPPPAFSLPGTTSGPQAPVSLIPSTPSLTEAGAPNAGRSSSSPARTVPAVIKPPPGSRTSPPAEATAAPPAAVTVAGRFSVLNSYDDSFIGQVLLTNRTNAPQDWVVTLTYPGNLRTSWLESLPQPTEVQRGHTFTWTSSVPLAAGSTGQLRFHFDRAGGSDNLDSCAVNGAPCA